MVNIEFKVNGSVQHKLVSDYDEAMEACDAQGVKEFIVCAGRQPKFVKKFGLWIVEKYLNPKG